MQCLGVHLEEERATLALVAKEKQGFVIKFLETFSAKEPIELALERLQGLIFKEKTFFIGTVLETSQVIIRQLEMPLKHKRAIYKALPFQLEQLLPQALEDFSIIPCIDKDVVTVFCTQKKTCEQHRMLCKKYHIDPEWIGCVPQALQRFAQLYLQESTTTIIHMGDRATHIVAIELGRISHAFQIDMGKEDFFQELRKDNPSLQKDKINTLFCDLLSSQDNLKNAQKKAQKFLQELDRIFYFLLEQAEDKSLSKVFITREESFFKRCLLHLENSLRCSLNWIEVKDPSHLAFKPYAVAIGEALDVLCHDEHTIQFRGAHDMQPALRKHLLKTLSLYCYSFVGALAAALLGLQVFIKVQEKFLKKELMITLETYAQEIKGLDEKKNFKGLLADAEYKLSHIKKSYGYHLPPKRLTDFLSYMQFSLDKMNEKEIFDLYKLHYELVSFPSVKDSEQPYKIKIELTLDARQQDKTETFLKMLCADPSWVVQDPLPQITQLTGRYEAIFFLSST